MKRCICLILGLGLLLCACAGAPAETTLPVETTTPAETTIPAQTTAPAETTEPAVSAPPVADENYTIRIGDPETLIYAGPALRSGSVAMVEEPGVYTIVEERTDADGNLWGRLKSGAGWICLTDPPLAPISADYAEESFNGYHVYWSGDSEYLTSIGFTPAEPLTDVKFGLLDPFGGKGMQMTEVLYTIDSMDPDHPFLAQVVFWGDMTTYGISFTDADGEARFYSLMISGRDGSLVCTEYMP